MHRMAFFVISEHLRLWVKLRFFLINIYPHLVATTHQLTRLIMSKEARSYAIDLANSMTKVTMESFFNEIHDRFYSDIDVSFMEYFLELTKHEYEFVVPHAKLIEYGVMTSARSNDILKKFSDLDLENGKDYLLRDISQQVVSGIKHCKQYTLTPEAFKKCLMGARRYTGQGVDPKIYLNYFLLLEKVFKLYMDYERQYASRLLQCKDDKIDEQSNKIDNLTQTVGKQSNQIGKLLASQQKLLTSNTKLLSHTTHIIVQNDNQAKKIDELQHTINRMFDFLMSFARVTIPAWIGSEVINKQYETLCKNKDGIYALKHLKVMFMVGFYKAVDEPMELINTVDGVDYIFDGRSHLKIYCCCTNFEDVRDRLRLLYRKHTTGREVMFMYQPQVVTLISCEINLERIILENSSIFPKQSCTQWRSKFKCFDVLTPERGYDSVDNVFKYISANATNERFQGYQVRIEEFTSSVSAGLSQDIISYIDETDAEFYSAAKPYCQQYVDNYSTAVYDSDSSELVEYRYDAPGVNKYARPDFNGEHMTTCHYALRKIEDLLTINSQIDHVEIMAKRGILRKKDLPTLRSVAEIEQIDVSGLKEPEGLTESSDSSDSE